MLILFFFNCLFALFVVTLLFKYVSKQIEEYHPEAQGAALIIEVVAMLFGLFLSCGFMFAAATCSVTNYVDAGEEYYRTAAYYAEDGTLSLRSDVEDYRNEFQVYGVDTTLQTLVNDYASASYDKRMQSYGQCAVVVTAINVICCFALIGVLIYSGWLKRISQLLRNSIRA